MKRTFIWFFPFFVLTISLFYSCRRYVSIYQLRKSPLAATDSTQWYDSAFAEEKFLLDTLLEGRASRAGFNGNVLCAYKGKIFYERSFGCKDIFLKDTMNMDCSF